MPSHARGEQTSSGPGQRLPPFKGLRQPEGSRCLHGALREISLKPELLWAKQAGYSFRYKKLLQAQFITVIKA